MTQFGTHRYREMGSTTRGTASVVVTRCDGVVSQNTQWLTHREGEVSGMFDTLIPNFHKRKASGEIFVNAMTKITQTFGGGGVGPQTKYLLCTPQTSTATYSGDYMSSRRMHDQAFIFGEVRNADGQLASPIVNLVDVERLKVLAYTSAMSDVDASTAEGLVSLAELPETLRMLRAPLSSMKRLTESFTKSKNLKAALVKSSTQGPRAIADQYLAYYYGMRPLMQDIRNILDAYLTEGITPARHTARGTANDSKTVTTTVGAVPPYGTTSSWFINELTTQQEVSVRAGILYVPTTSDYRKVLGFRIQDVPSALYEATPWSFFVDYFSNLGDLIRSLTPDPGIDYLAQWLTIRNVVFEQALTVDSGINAFGTVHARKGSEHAWRRVETVSRSPTGRYENIRLAYKTDWATWSLKKDLAVGSLAIQTMHRLFGRKADALVRNWAYPSPAKDRRS